MSSQVFADPEKLRDFVFKLRHYSLSVNETLSTMASRTNRLGESWRDQGYIEFSERLEVARQRMGHLNAVVEELAPQILADADRLDEYNRVR